MRRFAYPVSLVEDEDGRWLARFPDLVGAATDGATREEALASAADCLEEAIAGAMVAREVIPSPSPARGRTVVGPGALIAAKAALYESMRDSRIANVELARRLAVAEGEVRRMLDPKHATKIGRIEEALRLLGQRLLVEVGSIA
jgi:antitoxin HicB